jgi:hypothetical protein
MKNRATSHCLAVTMLCCCALPFNAAPVELLATSNLLSQALETTAQKIARLRGEVQLLQKKLEDAKQKNISISVARLERSVADRLDEIARLEKLESGGKSYLYPPQNTGTGKKTQRSTGGGMGIREADTRHPERKQRGAALAWPQRAVQGQQRGTGEISGQEDEADDGAGVHQREDELGNDRVEKSRIKKSERSTDAGRVHVRGYYRKDGTYVRPHTRRKRK